jgi:IstB-like ATP binding protein
VVFLGPGTGKTHLAIGLSIRACQAGHRVAFATAAQWVNLLADAHAAGRLQAELTRLGRYPLIVVDEVGYIPFEAEAANLFFQLVSARYERASLIVTSNKPFGRWGEVFGDVVVAAAMIDRLVHHAAVVNTKGTQTHIGGRSGRPGWWVPGWVSVGWLVEWDAKADLDLPAGDADLVDDQAEQALALVEVEAVERLGHAFGEAGQALAQPVAFGELASFGSQTDLLVGELLAASVDLGGAALDLGELKQPGLVKVDQPAAFGLGGVDLAFQAGKLSSEQLVVGGGPPDGDGTFAGQQHLRAQQHGADLVEHERVELVGADVALGAAAVLAAGAQRVVVAAVVVAVPGAVAAAHLVAVDADLAAAARPGRVAARRPARPVWDSTGCCRG